MSQQTFEAIGVTYTQNGDHYLFLRNGGVRSEIVMKMETADCGHPWWVAERLAEGMEPSFVAYVERLLTRANTACLVLESWEAALQEMTNECRSLSAGGYSPVSGIAATHHLRSAIKGTPMDEHPKPMERPEPIPPTHTWVRPETATVLGFDPDTLPVSSESYPPGTWPIPEGRVVQVPTAALDAYFGRGTHPAEGIVS